ncbi:MAG TPA: FeoA family protein [Dehalococcoidia bacterium]|nr:FeoA family protein [Dehalococcoidia bacterium]
MLIKPLHELKPKEKGRIVRVGGGDIRRRLLDMGLVSGSEVEMERVAPLGDPIEVKIKGYHLTLRKEEAANIQVEAEQVMGQPMLLAMASPGEVVQVIGIRAGWGLTRRLADMGLTPGVRIRVISSQMPGPVVIDLRGSSLALGHGMAQKIMVTVVKNG